MPLLKYFAWVGSFLVAALFAASWCFSVPIARSRPSDVPLNQLINIRIHTDHKWPDRVVFDTSRWRVPAENAQAETEATWSKPSQTPNPVDWHAPVEAFAEWDVRLSKTVSGLGVSRAATALTAPNPFHKLPGKS
jgi:hypothetical protein